MDWATFWAIFSQTHPVTLVYKQETVLKIRLAMNKSINGVVAEFAQ
jgi:hypothetical protein